MEFLILGPLEVRREDGKPVRLGGIRQRMLLAKLLLHPNQVVSSNELTNAVWGEAPPPSAAASLRSYVAGLRRALEDTGSSSNTLVTRSPGYLLRVDPERLDLHRFQRLDREGRQALASGDPARAADLLRQALDLWRGPALADVAAAADLAWPELVGVEELQVASTEARIEAELALGRHHELVAELEGLVRVYPLREHLHGQLMLALYRSGRQADALAAYRAARKVLVDELGIEPSVGLQRLEQAIRDADPSLDRLVPVSSKTTTAPTDDSSTETHKGFSSATQHSQRLIPVQAFKIDRPVSSLATGQFNGRLIVVAGSEDGTVRSWDLASGNPSERILTGHTGPVWGIALGILDSRLIAVSASDDQTLRVWDLENGTPVGSPLTGHTGPVNAVELGLLGGLPVAVSASDDQTLRVWNIKDSKLFGSPLLGHSDWVNSLAFTSGPDGDELVISGSTDKTIRIWDLQSGETIRTLAGHTDSVSSIAAALAEDGRSIVASGSNDQTIRIWDLQSGETIRTLAGHQGRVRAVAIGGPFVLVHGLGMLTAFPGVLNNRPVVVSGGNDRTVRVWDLEADHELPLLTAEHAGPVRTVAVAVLDKRPLLITGGDDRTIRIWSSEEAVDQQDQVEWLSDAPAEEDLLRRRPLAQAISARMRRIHDEEPYTSFLVHIDGPWGTGKSTLLNFLRAELEQDWVTVQFDAWREARVGPPWWALLAALRHGLERKLAFPARMRLRLAESFARLHRAGAPFILALTVLIVVSSAVLLLLQPSDLTLQTAGDLARTTTAVVTALGTLWAGTLVAGKFLLWDSARGARLFEQSSANPMQDVADHFEWMVAKAKRPVVFFIDDLDRCTESYVVELLDAVQTLIRDAGKRSAGRQSSSKVAACFVVAADGAWIRRSFEIAYEQFSQAVAEPGRPLGYLFLDKLFQLRVPVPSIDTTRQQEYLRELLRIRSPDQMAQSVGDEERAVRRSIQRSSTEKEIVDTLRRASAEVRDRVAEAAVEKLTTPSVEAATEHSLERFGPLLTPNPRSMKRFVNAYSALRAVRTLEGNPVRSEPLALWTILETRWPSLADFLRVNPQAIELLGKPAPDLEAVPSDLQPLFRDPAVRRLSDFDHGGPLTPELLRACCGAESQ